MKRNISLILFLLCASILYAQNIESFVRNQIATYPQLRLLDIYKSSFQDYMGAEHLVSNRQSVEAYLDEELKTTTLDELLPWYAEPCGTEGRYIRVSIRTIKENILSKEALLDAFIRSANQDKRPSVNEWKEKWQEMMLSIDRMHLNLPHYDEDKQFIERTLSEGKYAISHSPEYREAYRPHYRIIARDIFNKEIKPLINKSMIVRIAEIEVHPQYLEDYLRAAKNVGAESVKHEPGVICIFPMQMKEDKNQIRIIEIYRSQTAYESHLKTEHFLTYKQGTLHMVKSLRLLDQVPLDADSMGFIFRKMNSEK